MTYPINSQSQQIPGYSGITINITNPNISSGPQNHQCPPPPNPQCLAGQGCYISNPIYQYPVANNVGQGYLLPVQQNGYDIAQLPQSNLLPAQNGSGIVQSNQSNLPPVQSGYGLNQSGQAQLPQELNQVPTQPNRQGQQAYPAEYYINNYNYVQNEKASQVPQKSEVLEVQDVTPIEEPVSKDVVPVVEENALAQVQVEEQEPDLTSSKNIITDLDTRLAEQKELEKNGKKTRVIALTNEYIMSLENYLNNPNTEVRLMAAKEILTRLDEDKDRFDDAALNALLNKMLQDPEKLVRVAALSAFTSELASGNDYTVKLLNDIQTNPNADKEDVVDAANILLKMSASTEVKYLPQEQNQQVVVDQKVK